MQLTALSRCLTWYWQASTNKVLTPASLMVADKSGPLSLSEKLGKDALQ